MGFKSSSTYETVWYSRLPFSFYATFNEDEKISSMTPACAHQYFKTKPKNFRTVYLYFFGSYILDPGFDQGNIFLRALKFIANVLTLFIFPLFRFLYELRYGKIEARILGKDEKPTNSEALYLKKYYGTIEITFSKPTFFTKKIYFPGAFGARFFCGAVRTVWGKNILLLFFLTPIMKEYL